MVLHSKNMLSAPQSSVYLIYPCSWFRLSTVWLSGRFQTIISRQDAQLSTDSTLFRRNRQFAHQCILLHLYGLLVLCLYPYYFNQEPRAQNGPIKNHFGKRLLWTCRLSLICPCCLIHLASQSTVWARLGTLRHQRDRTNSRLHYCFVAILSRHSPAVIPALITDLN